MNTSAEIMNKDVTLITKVSAHVNTSGWNNRYLIILKTLFYSNFMLIKSTAKVCNTF